MFKLQTFLYEVHEPDDSFTMNNMCTTLSVSGVWNSNKFKLGIGLINKLQAKRTKNQQKTNNNLHTSRKQFNHLTKLFH